ncbi:MAG: hypothetical protein JXO72_05865 [Vicinamibacteria bacterium]|nr:hypothetical protein [Vicinamibacteria bacterium]
MPTHILVLMIAGGLLIGIGGLWFLSVAFRYGVLWGLLCIFVPFAFIVFLCTHWNDAKKPFLVSLLGGLAFGASVGIAAYEESKAAAAKTAWTAPSPSPTTRPTPSIETATPPPTPADLIPPSMPEATASTSAPSSTTAETQPLAQPTEAPVATIPEGLSGIVRPPRPPEPPSHASIKFEDLSQHMGDILRFRMKDGRSFEGRIREVGLQTLKVERNTNAGQMTFDIKLEEIAEVLKRL